MSTIYTFHQEVSTIDQVDAGDIFLVFDTSSGRTKSATRTQVIGGASSTASATSGAATLNFPSGVITTETLTTTGQSTYSLTVTNTGVTVGDIVLASVGNGTNTTGIPALWGVGSAAGTWSCKISNAATTATNPFGGTLKVNYLVLKV